MFTEERISRFLAVMLTITIIVAPAVLTGTATFAENRESKEVIETKVWKTAESDDYNQLNLEKLAKKYNVEKDYLDYIVEVEQTFGLEPYELIALIAQESEFIPRTIEDGGSYSYNTTQMKLNTAKTAYMAITEYYNKDIPYPTHELMIEDKYYAAMLAGGYLKYLHDTYKDKYESYTAYHRGIGGRLEFFKNNGHYKSSYALKVADLSNAFAEGKIKVER